MGQSDWQLCTIAAKVMIKGLFEKIYANLSF